MRLLISGFEPFGGSRLNSSALVATGITELHLVKGCKIDFTILPVDGLRSTGHAIPA